MKGMKHYSFAGEFNRRRRNFDGVGKKKQRFQKF
jgi:hypothetical protein